MDDVEVGIDGSGARRGADEVVKQIARIEKAADRMSVRAGDRINSLYSKMQRLAGVAAPAAAKISALNNLAQAMQSLSAARGPSSSAVKNISDLLRAVGNARVPTGLASISSLARNLSAFRGPTATSVKNLRDFFSVLARAPASAALNTLVTRLRFIAGAVAPVASALRSLQGAGGAAANGLRRAGGAARSTHADFVGLRASSLSLGGALLRTGEFASALGATLGIRAMVDEINTMQRSEAAIMSVTGSLAMARAEMEYLMQTARTFSVYVGDLTRGYSLFRTAANQAGFTLQETQGIFHNITQAVRVFNLSTQDADGVYRALTQIVSKGSLQMEELRGQLGDRMPVAVQAFARGLGVSVQALMEMTREGQVTGDTLHRGMIGFAEQVRLMTDAGLQLATGTLGAAFGDLRTTFYEFSNAMGQAGLIEAIRNIASALDQLMQDGHPLNVLARNLAGTFAFLTRHMEIFGIALGALAIGQTIRWVVGLQAAFMTFAGSVGVSTAALNLNSRAGMVQQATNGSMWRTLILLGTATNAQTGFQVLATTASVADTRATIAAAGAKTGFAAATAAATGAMRAFIAVLVANPITLMVVAITALAAAFFTLKDRTDRAREAQQRFQDVTNRTQESALLAAGSIRELANSYAEATVQARNLARAQSISQRAQARTDAEDALENLGNLPRDRRGWGMRGGGPGGRPIPWYYNESSGLTDLDRRTIELARQNPDSSYAAGITSRYLEQMQSLDPESDRYRTLQQVTSDFLTYAQARQNETAADIELALLSATDRVASSGSASSASEIAQNVVGRLDQRVLDMASRLGIAVEPATSDILSDTESSGSGSGSAADRAQQELEQRIQAANRLVGQLDGVYEATNRVSDAMNTLSILSDDALGSGTVGRTELFRRAINEAFRDLGQLDIESNLTAEWQDNERAVREYTTAMVDAGVMTADLRRRVEVMSRMDIISGYEEALGPLAQMAGAIYDMDRSSRQLADWSDRLELSESRRVDLAYRLAENFSNAAREIARGSSEGERLTSEMETWLGYAESIADLMDKSFGYGAAEELYAQVDALRALDQAVRHYEITATARDIPLAASAAIPAPAPANTAGALAGDQVEDVIVTAVRATSLDVAIGEMLSGMVDQLGTRSGEHLQAAISQAMDARAIDRDMQSLAIIGEILSGGGAAGELDRINRAIEMVNEQNRILGSEGTQAVRSNEYALRALREQAEAVRGAYYEAALESTRMGSVINNAFSNAQDAILQFVQTGELDLMAFFRQVQADILRTFVLEPMMNRLRETVAGMMGIKAPEDAGAAMNQAAGTQRLAAAALQRAADSQQALVAMERQVIADLGLAATQLQGAAQALAGGAGGSPLTGTVGAGVQPKTGVFTGNKMGGSITSPEGKAAEDLGVGASILNTASQALQSGSFDLGSAAMSLGGQVVQNMLMSAFSGVTAGTMQKGAAIATGVSAKGLTFAAGMLTKAALFSMAKNSIPLPIKHKGGIIGGSGSTRTYGIPTHHRGGVIGETQLIGQRRNEQLIMGLKGEEVLTEDDPRHIRNFYDERGIDPVSGGAAIYNSSNNVHNEVHVTVQGSGGNPAQNDDLARKVGKQVSRALDAKSRAVHDKRDRRPGMKVR